MKGDPYRRMQAEHATVIGSAKRAVGMVLVTTIIIGNNEALSKY